MGIVIIIYIKSVHDKHQSKEEPYETKVSRTVLKSRGIGWLFPLRLTKRTRKTSNKENIKETNFYFWFRKRKSKTTKYVSI